MIYISALRFNNEFRAAQDLGYLLGCIGEKVIIEVDFYIEDITWATTDNAVILEPTASTVDLSDVNGVIYSEDGVAFADFKVGDTIGVYTGAFAFYTVNEKYSDGLIRTNYGGAQVTLTTGTHYVFLATPIYGVRYAWNFTDIGQVYNSLIDGEFQQVEYPTADTDDTSYDTMTFKGLLSYQIGSVQVKGRTGVSGTDPNYVQQRFTIKHTTWITPLFLFNQYADLLLGIKPSYFQANNCLSYVSQIQINGDLSNPNTFKTFDLPFNQSNVGWFNERFNGLPTNYSLHSLVLTNNAVACDTLHIDDEVQFVATIRNTVNSPFSSTNTKAVFGFMYLPDDEAFYKDTGENFTTNFLFNTQLMTMDVVTGNHSGYGSSMQVIHTVNIDWNANYEAILTGTIQFGSAAKAILQQGAYSRYAMFLIIENHSLTAPLSDKVNLLLQVANIEIDLTTTDLIEAETKFIRHPFTNTEVAYMEGAGFDMFPVDDVAVQTDFSIDFTGKEDDGILIKKITNELVLTHATEADIVLDTFTADVSAYNLVDGLVQDIDFEQDRIFKVPAGEIRKVITIARNSDLDSGSVYNWQMNFPFMNRWEYWEALAIANPASGIYDRAEPLNGLNHFWNRLINVSGWTAKFRTTFEIEQNGQDFEQEFETTLVSSDFETGTEWGNEFIKSYDSTGATEQTAGGNKYILGYEDVLIKASFEKLSGLVPAATGVTIVIWIETFESGGINDIRRASSAYEVDSQSWFKSVDTSNKVKITKTGSTFLGEILIDYTKLPQNTAYNIYARIYDVAGGCATGAITDQYGGCLTDQAGVSILGQ